QAASAAALTAYDAATGADVSSLNYLDATAVQSAAAAALTAYDPPTRAELTTDKNSIISAMPAATDVSGLALETTAQGIATQTAKLDDLMEDDGGTWRFTANALEETPAGSSITAQEVWEY